jgi:hypothetical protein
MKETEKPFTRVLIQGFRYCVTLRPVFLFSLHSRNRKEENINRVSHQLIIHIFSLNWVKYRISFSNESDAIFV